jgi:hypothetical protein
MPSRLLAALSGALSAVAIATVPAHAETWHGRDAHGDVRAIKVDLTTECETIPAGDPQPSDRKRDITRLSVSHGAEDVVVHLGLSKVAPHDPDTSYAVFVHTPKRSFAVVTQSTLHGAVEIFIVRQRDHSTCGPSLASGHDIACDAAAADLNPRADQVRITIPRTCLYSPRWVSVGAQTVGVDDTHIGPNATHLDGTADVWGPPGTTLSELYPPSGPRVRRG